MGAYWIVALSSGGDFLNFEYQLNLKLLISVSLPSCSRPQTGELKATSDKNPLYSFIFSQVWLCVLEAKRVTRYTRQ
jgi:hypothetical protein